MANGHASGDGGYTRKCSRLLEDQLGVHKALLTPSCTHALEMAALLLDIRPGDEVIVPSFTFVSTANAFALRGARPVFADIRPDTLNLNEALLEALITRKTKAIVVVHYGGVGCEMDAIMNIAERHGLPVVEDNAHGLFGKYRGRWLGTFGSLATLSFHETKNFSCGEGGALLINDPKYSARAEILRDKGTNRSRFFRGEVDKYTWVDLGSSYVLSDLLAAFLLGQLENHGNIQECRQQVWRRYAQSLRDWSSRLGICLPFVPTCCEQTFHLFYMVLPSLELRSQFIQRLHLRNIHSVFHYQPLHLSPMGRFFGGQAGDCPVTEEVSDRLVRLPLYNSLTEIEQQRVIDAAISFMGESLDEHRNNAFAAAGSYAA